MEILDKKRIMLYKNEVGGKVTVKISLPTTEVETDVKRLYESLEKSYYKASEKFINEKGGTDSYCLSVSYEISEEKKYLIIKRLSELLFCGKTLLKKEYRDVFGRVTLNLKR
jgi:hypothetical protein